MLLEGHLPDSHNESLAMNPAEKDNKPLSVLEQKDETEHIYFVTFSAGTSKKL